MINLSTEYDLEFMVESKNFQISVLRKMLTKNHIEYDLIDLDSLVDATLSLSENARIIKQEYNLGGYVPDTVSVVKLENFLKAVENFNCLNVKSKNKDSRIEAKSVFERDELNNNNFNKWNNNKNRYDIRGVDSKY